MFCNRIGWALPFFANVDKHTAPSSSMHVTMCERDFTGSAGLHNE
jgi:hypothetical protein